MTNTQAVELLQEIRRSLNGKRHPAIDKLCALVDEITDSLPKHISPIDVDCPYCDALAGYPCKDTRRTQTEGMIKSYHADRQP